MNPNIYVYKLITDNGGAPCVWRNVLSLAICKPMIRRMAEDGALVFGFGGKKFSERLIYIAKVTNRLDRGEYYRLSGYANRPDCIYRDVEGKPKRKRGARFHAESDERWRDVGPKFERGVVLLSDDFRYLGREGTDQYKREFPAIKTLIEGLKRGHRVNHSQALREQLLELRRQTWEKYPSIKKVGVPTQTDQRALCNRSTPSAECRR
jgi:Nucleotide modification associated domain 2